MLKIIKETRDNIIKLRDYAESLSEEEAEYSLPTIREESGFISDLIKELDECLVSI